MKKFVCLALIFLMLFSLCACGEHDTVEPEALETDAPESAAPETDVPEKTPEPTETPESTEEPVSVCTVTLTDACATGLNLPEDKICTVDSEGGQILITFYGDAKQVRLCSPVYDDNLNYLGPGDVLWAGGDMPSGSQIGLKVFIPDVFPNVILCYSDGAGNHVYGIFQSGYDGSLMLVGMQKQASLN